MIYDDLLDKSIIFQDINKIKDRRDLYISFNLRNQRYIRRGDEKTNTRNYTNMNICIYIEISDPQYEIP